MLSTVDIQETIVPAFTESVKKFVSWLRKRELWIDKFIRWSWNNSCGLGMFSFRIYQH